MKKKYINPGLIAVRINNNAILEGIPTSGTPAPDITEAKGDYGRFEFDEDED